MKGPGMRQSLPLFRVSRTIKLVAIALGIVLGAVGLFSGSALASANGEATANSHKAFHFSMVPSNANITACLPHARGEVTIHKASQNDVMVISVSGLAPNTGYDLFVNELPHGPFGVSWYQSDLKTNRDGEGTVTVQGIFDVETFSISPGGPTTTFPATHQYHLGLWFDDPSVPFQLGCEPGARSPIVTPFNGVQHAGPQVLNTSNFPDKAGPLSHVSA